MRGCKKCTICLFISVAAVILALMAYFHKIKATEGFSPGSATIMGKEETSSVTGMQDDLKWEIKKGDTHLIFTHGGKEALKLNKRGDLSIQGNMLIKST